MLPNDSILLARVVSVHGVRGDVKVKSFTTPALQLFKYQNIHLDGVPIQFSKKSALPNGYFIISCVGIDMRDKASTLVGKELRIDRAILPPLKENEFYLFDVIGCHVFDHLGIFLGTVSRIDHFGAGDIMTLINEGSKEVLLPLNKDFIERWDLPNKKLILKAFEVVEG